MARGGDHSAPPEEAESKFEVFDLNIGLSRVFKRGAVNHLRAMRFYEFYIAILNCRGLAAEDDGASEIYVPRGTLEQARLLFLLRAQERLIALAEERQRDMRQEGSKRRKEWLAQRVFQQRMQAATLSLNFGDDHGWLKLHGLPPLSEFAAQTATRLGELELYSFIPQFLLRLGQTLADDPSILSAEQKGGITLAISALAKREKDRAGENFIWKEYKESQQKKNFRPPGEVKFQQLSREFKPVAGLAHLLFARQFLRPKAIDEPDFVPSVLQILRSRATLRQMVADYQEIRDRLLKRQLTIPTLSPTGIGRLPKADVQVAPLTPEQQMAVRGERLHRLHRQRRATRRRPDVW